MNSISDIEADSSSKWKQTQDKFPIWNWINYKTHDINMEYHSYLFYKIIVKSKNSTRDSNPYKEYIRYLRTFKL